jgi:cytochrome c5
MECQTINPRSLLSLALIMVVLMISTSSCYYDNEEYVYPDPTECDVSDVTYSGTVVPILDNACNACHNSNAPSAGIITDNYNDLQTIINDGSFRGAINHLPGYSPMPQGGNKLNSCDLAGINTWLDDGAPNN